MAMSQLESTLQDSEDSSSSDSDSSDSNQASRVPQLDFMEDEAPSVGEGLADNKAVSFGTIKLTACEITENSEGLSIEKLSKSRLDGLGKKESSSAEGEGVLTETSSAASDILCVERQLAEEAHVNVIIETSSQLLQKASEEKPPSECFSPIVSRGIFLKKPISEEAKTARGRNSLTGVNRLGSLSPKKKPLAASEADGEKTPTDTRRSLKISGSPEVLTEASKIMETAKLRNSSNGPGPKLSKETAGPATSKAQARNIKRKTGKDIGSAPSACAGCLLY
mmetsp:Transcript_9491/g.18331  ORF Transcript_9491/g.18331 Transcript_9491/m.18331 type:complete len:280 (+) Transcript_9491:243-1082(+)